MISAFYPAQGREGAVEARMVDIFEPAVTEALEYLTDGLKAEIKEELLGKLRLIGLQSIRSGPPKRSIAPYPVLIYYPAGGCNRFANVDVCEALASHGYVVLAMDGPHDAPLVVFSGQSSLQRTVQWRLYFTRCWRCRIPSQPTRRTESRWFACRNDRYEASGYFWSLAGGYIANISAFLHERVKAALSIDSFLWGYMSEGTGLEKHPPDFQAKVRSTAKPLLRLCGRPADTNPQQEAELCLKRDGGDFIGGFSAVAFPGWAHGDFITTPWSCGKGADLVANQSRVRIGAAETLTDILATFFDIQLSGANSAQLDSCIRRYPALGIATQVAMK